MSSNVGTSRSAELYERARKVIPGGVSRNTVLRRPHPFYAAEGSGCWVTDVEGVRRLDAANNMCSLIHGHAHPAVVEAIARQARRGTAFTFATEVEIELAEHLCARAPGIERIRFVNSGTEAVMACIKAARAFTGRSKIAKVEGAYHGLYDYAEVGQNSHPGNWGDPERPRSTPVAYGTPPGVLEDVILLPFNESGPAVRLLDEHRGEIAAVLIDPLPHRLGFVPATPEFFGTLHEWTRRDGALLICDEVITFRCAYGGAQTAYAQMPDLTALGKIIGGGLPIGAIGGRAEVMEVMDPLSEKYRFPHSGTFSANPLVMSAGLTAMRLYDESEVERLNALGRLARARIAEAIRQAKYPACVTGESSFFRIHLRPEPPKGYRDLWLDAEGRARLDAFLDRVFARGLMLIGTASGALSTPMSESEIDHIAEIVYAALREMPDPA